MGPLVNYFSSLIFADHSSKEEISYKRIRKEEHILTFQTLQNLANESLQLLVSKIQEIAQKIFKIIKTTSSDLKRNILDIVWPYEPAKIKEGHSLFGEIIKQGLLQQPSIKADEEEHEILPVSIVKLETPITIAYLVTNAFLPFFVSSACRSSFATTAITAMAIQNFTLKLFNRGLNKPFLEEYKLIPQQKADVIDRHLYQGGIILSAYSLTYISQSALTGSLNKPLHFAVALTIICSPLQNKVMKLPHVQKLSQLVHRLVEVSHTAIKRPLKGFIRKLVINQIQKHLVPAADFASEYMANEWDKQLKEKFNSQDCKYLERLNSVLQVVGEHHLAQPLQEAIGTSVNSITDRLADIAINKTVLIAQKSIELYFSNRALGVAFKTHPLLSAASLIIAGGSQQKLGELSLRVTGAAVFLFTGSSFLSLAIIHIPSIIDYGLTLRGKYIKKCGWQQDPALERFKSLFNTIQIRYRIWTKTKTYYRILSDAIFPFNTGRRNKAKVFSQPVFESSTSNDNRGISKKSEQSSIATSSPASKFVSQVPPTSHITLVSSLLPSPYFNRYLIGRVGLNTNPNLYRTWAKANPNYPLLLGAVFPFNTGLRNKARVFSQPVFESSTSNDNRGISKKSEQSSIATSCPASKVVSRVSPTSHITLVTSLSPYFNRHIVRDGLNTNPNLYRTWTKANPNYPLLLGAVFPFNTSTSLRNKARVFSKNS